MLKKCMSWKGKKMTRDDIKNQFPDATDEQITAILDIYGTDINNAKKNNVDPKELKRLQGIEAEYTKLKEADLTDAEKIQKALNEAEDTKLEYEKKFNQLEAERILVSSGLTEDDYKDLMEGIVSSDIERTRLMANSLASVISRQKETAMQKAKEELMDGTPIPNNNSGSGKEEESEAEKAAKAIADSQKTSNDATKSVLENYL